MKSNFTWIDYKRKSYKVFNNIITGNKILGTYNGAI